MNADNEANLRMASAFMQGRRIEALRMANGFSNIVGGLPGRSIERGSAYIEGELARRDEAMVRLFLGIDSSSLSRIGSSLTVPRSEVADSDIVWDGVPKSRKENPDYHVTLGVRRQIASQFNLTERHPDILAAIIAGDTENGQIAEHLVISISTVKTHLERIYRSLDATGKPDAALKSIREGIIFWVV